MKRLYIAAALLILLLGASLANGWYARKVTGEMCKELRQAQLLAEVEDCPRRNPSPGRSMRTGRAATSTFTR